MEREIQQQHTWRAQQSNMTDYNITIEKLHQLKQIQIIIQKNNKEENKFSNPLCTISNEYPNKPILHIKQRTSNEEKENIKYTAPTASILIDPSIIHIPLNVRVDLTDSRNRITNLSDCTIISLVIKQDLIEEINEDELPTKREKSKRKKTEKGVERN